MKYYGKEKCRILREIRAEIARQNDIAWTVEACTHKGNCRGTCPRCEAEVTALEKALERRQAVGKAVAVAGVAAAITLSVVGCDPGGVFTRQGMMETESTTQSGSDNLPGGDVSTDGTEPTTQNVPDYLPGEPEGEYLDGADGQ